VNSTRPHRVCLACGQQQRGLFRKGEYWYCRCRGCGLTSLDPIPDSATIDRHYEHKFESGNYQLLSDFAPQYRRIYEGYADALGKLIDFSSHPAVLDIGCFTGDFLCILAERGVDVYGLELQEKAAALAEARLPGRVFQARVESSEFPQRMYDAITLLAVIEHVTDPKGLVEHCAARLKPGGVMMLQTPNTGSLLCRLSGRFWPPYAPVEHLHLFSARSLERIVRDAGLTAVEVRNHWKTLPVAYVYQMLENFGPEVHRLARPFYGILPNAARKSSLPFYVGEMLMTARKPL
jgi:2-polyprenyl-3-methyl-5-hydroxy-6-metoxy-1,4-benzoquinol methylase